MNYFLLEANQRGMPDPLKSAESQCDKHIVKMPVESAQMLSTAHRMLDGTIEIRPSKSGKRNVKYWKLDDHREDILYKAVHMGHPCTVWTMESHYNYLWHVDHFEALCAEYKYRYNREHKSSELIPYLRTLPNNIPLVPMTPFKLAMAATPECIFKDDPVKSYRMFYQTKQSRFEMKWTKREVPEWFEYVS